MFVVGFSMDEMHVIEMRHARRRLQDWNYRRKQEEHMEKKKIKHTSNLVVTRNRLSLCII